MKTVVLILALFNHMNAQSPEGPDFREAQFTGGSDQCSRYLFTHLKYPETAAVRHIEGSVSVVFTVDAEGMVRDAKVRRGLGQGCDEEALRLVQNMPRWEPATLNGIPIASGRTLRVEFRMTR